MHGKPCEDVGGPGAIWDCPIEFGVCTICGRSDYLPWWPMHHEFYGLWWKVK